MTTKKTQTPGQTSKRDYCAIAARYIEDVLSGRQPACKWVRLACERQRRDIGRAKVGELPWEFKKDRAARVCKFIELLPHIEGKWKTPNITLEPWQIFILTTVFGWVDAEGNRRFRTGYVEIPRKNAKSTLSAGVGLYMVAADGEPGAQVYSAATNREQAHAVWNPAHKMAGRTAGLRSRFGVQPMAHSIAVPQVASAFKPLSADANSLDGLNIHCAIVDELHAHKTRAVFDVLNSATGSRRQPLIWLITTAGFNRAGVCYEQRGYVCKLLEGTHDDERYFGAIWTIDESDDWTARESWIKANPNFGVSVLEEDIATMCRQAMLSAASQNNFLTKRLNVWVNADTAWMNMQAWDKCADRSLKAEDFSGDRCWIGLDLSSKVDVTAKVRVFERDGHYYSAGNSFYLPEDVVEHGINTNCSHYAGWAREGLMALTSGSMVDQDRIEEDVRGDLSAFQVERIAFDPWNAAQLTGHLMRDGAPMLEVRATVQNFSEPMKMLEALVLDGRFHHDGNPIMAWMISNVVCHQDAKGNIYPRKERAENKIDGPVALMMALSLALAARETQSAVIEFW